MGYLQKKNRTKQPEDGGLMRFVSGSPCWARTNIQSCFVHFKRQEKWRCKAIFLKIRHVFYNACNTKLHLKVGYKVGYLRVQFTWTIQLLRV